MRSNDARRRGAKIIVVDPRRSGSAAIADRWLRVRPGCDLALLLGIAHVLIAEGLYDHEFVARYTTGFDELAQAASAWMPEWAESMSDVPAEEIVATARDLAAPRLPPWWMRAFMAASVSRMPTVRRRRALSVWSMCCWAASDMRAVPSTRPHRLRWAIWTLRVSRRRRCHGEPKLGSERYPLVDPERGLCTTIGQSILAGDLRGLIVYASNPGAGYGNAQAWLGILQQLDLLVTIDIRWSETARASDFVLPDVTYLEADRGVGTVVGVNDSRVFYRNAVLPVQHDGTRPGREIFAGLRRRVAWASISSLRLDDLTAAQVAPFGIDLDELKERGWADTGVALPSRTGEPVIPLAGGKIALQATYGNESAWVVCPTGLRPLWSPARGCFASLVATVPLSRTPRAGLAAQGAAEAGIGPGCRADECRGCCAHGHRRRRDRRAREPDMGRDRVRVETTPYLHPACIFTSAAPGGRSLGADVGGAQALGVGRSTIRRCVGIR